MSANERKTTKITIETPTGSGKEFECQGFAGVTLNDLGDKYQMGVVLIGELSVKDLIALHDSIEDELLRTLKQNAISFAFSEGVDSSAKDELLDLMAKYLGGK